MLANVPVRDTKKTQYQQKSALYQIYPGPLNRKSLTAIPQSLLGGHGFMFHPYTGIPVGPIFPLTKSGF